MVGNGLSFGRGLPRLALGLLAVLVMALGLCLFEYLEKAI